MAAPFLSIVIPAYNEAERLPATLTQLGTFLCGEGYPAEIIVVDDGSTDGTPAAVRAGASSTPAAVRGGPSSPPARLIEAPHAGKRAAVRRGMLAAGGQ